MIFGTDKSIAGDGPKFIVTDTGLKKGCTYKSACFSLSIKSQLIVYRQHKQKGEIVEGRSPRPQRNKQMFCILLSTKHKHMS